MLLGFISNEYWSSQSNHWVFFSIYLLINEEGTCICNYMYLLYPQRTEILIQRQPTTYATSLYQPKDHFRSITILVCIICSVFGSPLTLLCTIPAIFTSAQVCLYIYMYISAVLVTTGEKKAEGAWGAEAPPPLEELNNYCVLHNNIADFSSQIAP